MKINLATSPPATARVNPAARAVNFTQLIEQGGAAKDITANRALGFAESGLLGIHAAVLNGGGSAAGNAEIPPLTVPPENRPQQFLPWGGPLIVSVADLLRDGVEPNPEASVEILASSPTNGDAALEQAPTVSQPDGVTEPCCPAMAVDTHLAEPDLPMSARLAGRSAVDMPLPREAGAMRFELNMLNEQSATIVTDMAFEQLDKNDLARIRDVAAREFGVTVGQIIIRSKPELFFGNQRGN